MLLTERVTETFWSEERTIEYELRDADERLGADKERVIVPWNPPRLEIVISSDFSNPA